MQLPLLKLEELRAPLKVAITLYEKRVKWLKSGSRGSFGVVNANKRVAILVDDTFEDAAPLRKQLEQLIEQQLGGMQKVVLCAVGPDGIVGDIESDVRVPSPQEFPPAGAGESAVGQLHLNLMVNFFLKFSQSLRIVTGRSSPLCIKLRQC